MLKTVGRYETEEKIFVIKVRTKQEPACVNIIDTTDEYFEEFAIIPVDSDLEPCEEYTEKRKQQKLVEHHQDHSSDQGESSRSSESCRMQSPNATAGKTFSVGDKGATAAAGAKRRPQICEMCGKVVSNITQHLKHHDKEKEMCQVCSRPVRKVLRHRHSCNLKLYGCSCGVSFALKGEIEAHMREY
uniref:C2H2-type domain-containing protein n=2 Tax=Lutzomyia longipalpis TaxID=7200 RepID=A0A1B0CQ05_LUTLO